MRWEVCLAGHRAILEMLGTVEQSDALKIRFGDERCFLASSLFEMHSDASAVLEVATHIVGVLNGFARLAAGRRHDISISTVTEFRADGTAHDFAFFREELELRSSLTVTVTYADGTSRTQGPRQLFTDKASACVSSPAMSRVLEIYGQGELDWSNLYRVVELVSKDCGGQRNLEKLGLAMLKDVKRFNRSANDPAVSGNTARHGVFKNESIKNPMSIRDARAFVERILSKWIASK